MKRKSLIAILMLMLGGVLTVSVWTRPTAADSTVPTYQIGVGETKFWDGEYVAPGGSCENCEFKLVTPNGGARLRVGLDLLLDYTADGSVHPSAEDGRTFTLQIFNEQGVDVTPREGNSFYTVELFLCFNRDLDGDGVLERDEMCMTWDFNDPLCEVDPTRQCIRDSAFAKSFIEGSQNTWTIKVTPSPDSNAGWKFRMRAKLEAPTEPPATRTELLPNLRAIPPFEVTFKEPLVTAGFVAGHTPVDGDGFTDQEKADLIAEEGPAAANARAIRFSAGPENVGAGYFEIRGSAQNPDTSGEGHYIAYQRTYYSDGTPTPEDREAGVMEFHAEHGHIHYQFFRYELYEVTRTHPTQPWREVKLGERTQGKKVGFCPADERMGAWDNFFQDDRQRWMNDRTGETPDVPLCVTPHAPLMGLSVGWGDLYEWARVEQFLVFPTNMDGSLRDGYYLLRSTVDAEGKVAESNEEDNSSHVLFEVRDGQIEIITRGYGPDPDGNVAAASTGATAEASSTSVSHDYSPSGAINGDRKGLNWEAGGGWNDATRDLWPDHWTVRFNGEQTISEVRVYTLQNNFPDPQEPTPLTPADYYGIRDFEVQTCTGTAVLTCATIPAVGTVTGNDKAMRVFILATPIDATAVRIKVNSGRSHFSRLVEVEAFGYQAQ